MELWIAALRSRNNVAHAYNEIIALEIVRGTKERYYKMFCELEEEIERNCTECSKKRLYNPIY